MFQFLRGCRKGEILYSSWLHYEASSLCPLLSRLPLYFIQRQVQATKVLNIHVDRAEKCVHRTTLSYGYKMDKMDWL